MIHIVLEALSCVAAVYCARLWFLAAKVQVPPFLNDKIGGGGPFADAVAEQSRLNAKAARAAAVAALFQGLALASLVFQNPNETLPVSQSHSLPSAATGENF